MIVFKEFNVQNVVNLNIYGKQNYRYRKIVFLTIVFDIINGKCYTAETNVKPTNLMKLLLSQCLFSVFSL